MFRSILAAAAATLSITAFASSAQACISCEYVPEVVREHSTFKAKQHHTQIYAAAPRRARPTAPIVKAAPRRIETASINKKPEASVASAETTKSNTSASLALLKTETEALPATAEKSPAPVAEAPAKIETASTAPVVEPVADAKEPVGCKRFIPAVGVTLSVACD